MEMNVHTTGNAQIICTMPERFTPKQGKNPVSDSLRDRPWLDSTRPKYQKRDYKRTRSLTRAMNCKTVDKFDAGTHPDYPKAKLPSLRRISRGEIRSLCLAGAEIHYDPWAFTRKIIYNGHIMGACTMADIESLVQAKIVHQIPGQHGTRIYRH